MLAMSGQRSNREAARMWLDHAAHQIEQAVESMNVPVQCSAEVVRPSSESSAIIANPRPPNDKTKQKREGCLFGFA